MEVIINETYEEMSRSAADAVAEVLNAKPNAVLGMATGSTPLGVYQELVRHAQGGELDFSHVTTFNLDEYVGLPVTHPQSYHALHAREFFPASEHPAAEYPHSFRHDAGTTPRSASGTKQRIRECGGIDLQILGIGSDGHIAFNEPASSLSSRTRLKTLAKSTIDDNARFFKRRDEVPIYAITMGVGTILESRKILLLANGKKKADASNRWVDILRMNRRLISSIQCDSSALLIQDGIAEPQCVADRWPATDRRRLRDRVTCTVKGNFPAPSLDVFRLTYGLDRLRFRHGFHLEAGQLQRGVLHSTSEAGRL